MNSKASKFKDIINMDGPFAKKRSFSMKRKSEILKEIDNGSIQSVSRKHCIHDTVLRRWIKQRKVIEEAVEKGSSQNLRNKRAQNFAVEEALYSWFLEMRAKGFFVSGPALRTKALSLNEELGESPDFRASNGWLENFKKRRGIATLAITEENMSVDIEEEENRKLHNEERLVGWQNVITGMKKAFRKGDNFYRQSKIDEIRRHVEMEERRDPHFQIGEFELRTESLNIPEASEIRTLPEQPRDERSKMPDSILPDIQVTTFSPVKIELREETNTKFELTEENNILEVPFGERLQMPNSILPDIQETPVFEVKIEPPEARNTEFDSEMPSTSEEFSNRNIKQLQVEIAYRFIIDNHQSIESQFQEWETNVGKNSIMWSYWEDNFVKLEKRIIVMCDLKVRVFLRLMEVSLPGRESVKNLEDVVQLLKEVAKICPCEEAGQKNRANNCVGYVTRNDCSTNDPQIKQCLPCRKHIKMKENFRKRCAAYREGCRNILHSRKILQEKMVKLNEELRSLRRYKMRMLNSMYEKQTEGGL